MKKILLSITIILSILHLSAANASPLNSIDKPAVLKGKFSSFPPSLYKAIIAIESLSEAADLIDEVQKDGPVIVESQYFVDSDFEALWDSENRIIYVNAAKNDTQGKAITSILFELHNAKTNTKLKRLFKQATSGQIDKDSYVESIERMEHQNALNTTRLLEKGIALKIFPEDSRWSIFTNFDDHYKIQQIYGHSQWIADKFDALCPAPRRTTYHGTIPGLEQMSLKEKDAFIQLLICKNQNNSNFNLEECQRSFESLNSKT